MDALPFELLAGDALHVVRGPVARLLAAYPDAPSQAEIIVAGLRAGDGRAVFFHAGNGPFDVYDQPAREFVAVEVKLRQSKVATDSAAWGRKSQQMFLAERARVELSPVIEQIVTDEHGRRTWLVFPGIIPPGRLFVARGPLPVSTQLDRFVDRRLQSRGGAVLLRDVPADEYAA